MSVVLGPVAAVGETRFAVLSRQRVASATWARGAFLHGEKTPLWVLFLQDGVCWAEAPGGARLTEEELRARYPAAHADFRGGAG